MGVQSAQLRRLLASGEFQYMPSATTPLEGRLAEAAGVKVVYTGGYATGAALAVSEPLLTMDEQVRVAAAVARAVSVPLVADAGAGFGEPLHAMRTVREFAGAGIAGIHIEDQLFPKRAHYHKYVAHAVPVAEFVDKIRWACRERDRVDPDFVIIARSDTCREFGLDEAMTRVNAAAEAGADLGLVFPRNDAEAEAAPQRSKLPLIWVQSRGNRDGRPVYPLDRLKAMGYRGCIDAQLLLGVAAHHIKQALAEMQAAGVYSGIGDNQFTAVRKEIEDLIGLDDYYRIEAETVEK
jgi:2-methylisocitrate lyase-like PEP mutase family enzyme